MRSFSFHFILNRATICEVEFDLITQFANMGCVRERASNILGTNGIYFGVQAGGFLAFLLKTQRVKPICLNSRTSLSSKSRESSVRFTLFVFLFVVPISIFMLHYAERFFGGGLIVTESAEVFLL